MDKPVETPEEDTRWDWGEESSLEGSWEIEEPEMSPFAPAPVSTPKNEKVEQTLAGMAGGVNYSEVKNMADFREMSLREQLATSTMFARGLTAKDKAGAVSALAAPLPTRTAGEAYSATISDPSHSKESRNKLAEATDTTIAADITEEGVKKNLELGAEQSVWDTPMPAATAILDFLNDEPRDKEATLTDLVEHLNPIGMEEEGGEDIDFWEHVGDLFTGDFDSAQFDKEMTSNYGENWGSRFTGWLAKEIAIDAAVLGAGIMFPPVGAVIGFNKATKVARFGAAVGRALWVGAGGTGAQAAQDAIIDRETNYATEFMLRAGGEGVGELLAYGGKAAYAKVFGKSKAEVVEELAEGAGTKSLTQTAVRNALLERRRRPSQVASLVEHQLIADTRNYGKVMNEVADQIFEGSAKGGLEEAGEQQTALIKEGLAKLMGKEVSELDDLNMDAVMPMILDHGRLMDDMKSVAMKNDEALGHGVGYDLLGRYENEYGVMKGIYDYHISNNKLTFRESMKGAAQQLDNFITRNMKRMRIVEGSELVDEAASNWLATKNFNANMQRGFDKMYKETFKGLSKKERATLMEMLAKGDSEQKVFDIAAGVRPELAAGPITEAVEKAYAKFRFMDDLAFEVHDANMAATFKNTLRVDGDGTYWQVKSTTNDEVQVVKFDRKELGPTKETGKFSKTAWEAMKAPDTVLQYRRGHLPQGYAPKRHAVVVFDPNTGAAAREALFDTAVDAEAYRAKRAAAASKGDSKEVVMMLRNDADSGARGVRYDKTTKDLLAGLDKGSREALEKQLIENGIDPKHVAEIMHINFKPMNAKLASSRKKVPTAVTKDAQDLRIKAAEHKAGRDKAIRAKKEISDLKKKIAATSSKEAIASHNTRIKELEGIYQTNEADFTAYGAIITRLQSKELRQRQLLPAEETYKNYIHRVANASGNMHWRAFAGEHFFKKYEKHLLPSVKDPLDITENSFLADVPQVIKDAGIRHSKWLKRAVKEKTFYEEWHDRVLNSLTRKLAQQAQTSNTAKVFSEALDYFPSATGLLQGTRYFAAFPKLLTLNAAQIIVQGSQAVGTVGYAAITRHPLQLIKDVAKVPALGVIHAATRMGRAVPNNKLGKLYKELIQSGYAADLATADTDFGLTHALNPSSLGRMWDLSKAIGAAPFRTGEAFNRVTAYVTVREQLARKIMKGGKGNEVYGIAGTPLKKSDIGTESFRHAVVEKASVLALNMGKAGQLEATSGAGSVLLQFKQVLAKEVSLFNSATLKPHEKLGVAAGLVGMFGVGAIPLSYDALRLADLLSNDDMDPLGNIKATRIALKSAKWFGNLTQEATNGLVDSKTMQELLARGAISAWTEGEVNFANRVALGSFISETFQVQNVGDAVVSVAVLQDYLGLAKAIGLDAVNPLNFMEYLYDMSQGVDSVTSMKKFVEEDTVAWKILNSSDFTWQAAALQTLREGGRVFSAAGSVSRALDASNYRHTDEGAWVQHGNDILDKYRTSNLRPVDVERTDLRDWSFWLGITPGKMVEAYSKENMSRLVKDGLKAFARKQEKIIRETGGDPATMARIGAEGVEVLKSLQEFVTAQDLAVQLPKDIFSWHYKKQVKYLMNLKNPGDN